MGVGVAVGPGVGVGVAVPPGVGVTVGVDAAGVGVAAPGQIGVAVGNGVGVGTAVGVVVGASTGVGVGTGKRLPSSTSTSSPANNSITSSLLEIDTAPGPVFFSLTVLSVIAVTVTEPSIGTEAVTSLLSAISTGPLWTTIPIGLQTPRKTSPLVRFNVMSHRLKVD